MDKPKMLAWDGRLKADGVRYHSDYAVAAHHAEWEAYVADMAEELDATIDQRDLLSREVLRLERELARYREAASSAREGSQNQSSAEPTTGERREG